MRPIKSQPRGFTLIELIMVMVILTVVVGMIAPSLRGFTLGRRTYNTASTILGLTQYARSQAITEGRVYRLNFDPTNRAFWLTTNNAGTFSSPSNDFGKRFQTETNATLQVEINPRITPLAEQQSTTIGLMPTKSQPTDPYIEFQPSGRTDPAKIFLRDNLGTTIEIGSLSATESFRILPQAEMTR